MTEHRAVKARAHFMCAHIKCARTARGCVRTARARSRAARAHLDDRKCASTFSVVEVCSRCGEDVFAQCERVLAQCEHVVTQCEDVLALRDDIKMCAHIFCHRGCARTFSLSSRCARAARERARTARGQAKYMKPSHHLPSFGRWRLEEEHHSLEIRVIQRKNTS